MRGKVLVSLLVEFNRRQPLMMVRHEGPISLSEPRRSAELIRGVLTVVRSNRRSRWMLTVDRVSGPAVVAGCSNHSLPESGRHVGDPSSRDFRDSGSPD